MASEQGASVRIFHGVIRETPHSPSLRLIQQLAGDPDQHAVGKRRLQARLGELV